MNLPEANTAANPLQRAAQPKAFTVGEVVSRIRSVVEGAFPSSVWIEGEASNCRYYPSGHIYFKLVDEQETDRRGQRLVLPCAFFSHANKGLRFKLEDGMKVLCLGQVGVYEGRGEYQLIVLQLLPKGIGELQKAFEQLKKRLGAEGLFEEARKRPIPPLPDRVGIITSTAGSAIHDMVSTLRGHFHVIILPAKVQGDGAADEISEAIDLASQRRLADVLIVGRGGGSVEDLWAFNEEPVARAICRSRIPVISAVGHQDDWTIADYVADLRASTPTDAAKRLVHEQQRFADQARELVQGLLDAMRLFLDDQVDHVEHLGQRLRLLHPRHHVEQYTQRAHESVKRLVQSMRHALEREDAQLRGFVGRLQALNPLAVLARGYSVTLKLPDRHVVTKADALRSGDLLETLLAHGRVTSAVTQTHATHHQATDGTD